ncbi:ceramidase domain-containing protein [Marinobacterium sedimentorum]|uniref:ceramidase domain-containing protein n=1 Tax=Marinobacterium sedimentorum TaxID=2927804 RepID=UPI0020C6F7FD|nr:ceramidase domain-containing protein [Marinobacterium sedimentorum]MCP8689866.1 ceramidase [Marinobacterium sedimentorum]
MLDDFPITLKAWCYSHRSALAGLLLFATSLLILVLFLTEPWPQNLDYHAFADPRPFIHVPNALNVLSNLPFALVGIIGLAVLRKRPGMSRELVTIYACFMAGLVCVALGSAYYHLHPGNNALVWDRLPMAVCFAAFTSIVVAERLGLGAGRTLFPWLLALAILSVLYWHWRDDLKLYLLVQFGPVLILPLIILTFRGPGTLWLWLTLAFYVLAKVLETWDARVYELSGTLLSGHTLKHLAAAAGALMLVLKLHWASTDDA